MIKFPGPTRKDIYLSFEGKCGQCGRKDNLQIHHLIHNTILNRKLFGDRIQSKENGYLCCESCHSKYSLWDRKLVKQLKDKWNEESNKAS